MWRKAIGVGQHARLWSHATMGTGSFNNACWLITFLAKLTAVALPALLFAIKGPSASLCVPCTKVLVHCSATDKMATSPWPRSSSKSTKDVPYSVISIGLWEDLIL